MNKYGIGSLAIIIIIVLAIIMGSFVKQGLIANRGLRCIGLDGQELVDCQNDSRYFSRFTPARTILTFVLGWLVIAWVSLGISWNIERDSGKKTDAAAKIFFLILPFLIAGGVYLFTPFACAFGSANDYEGCYNNPWNIMTI